MRKVSLGRVLIVEDDNDSLVALAKLLRLAGYDVDCADGYQAALEIGRRGKFDLVLCDIGLWDGDGCHLFRELKAMNNMEGIAVTGYGMPDDIERCMEAGFKSHILKPFHYEHLLKLIADGLNEKTLHVQPNSDGHGGGQLLSGGRPLPR